MTKRVIHFKISKVIFGLIFLNLILLGVFLYPFASQSKAQQPIKPKTYPELAQFKNPNLTYDQLARMLQIIAQQKGAEYAYDVLRQASLPSGTDTHLLGHVVGDELYKQKGADGIAVCGQDFRNACSHSIVIGLLLDKGVAGLEEIRQACKKAPGGLGAYSMCFHGLGHGVLAYNQYDFPKTIEMCQKTNSNPNNNQEAAQCIGGAIMEIISGGGHDHQLWVKQRPLYLKPNDPLYLCQAKFMPGYAKNMCITYITPYLWEAVGANMSNPNSQDFAKAFQLCTKISKDTDPTLRNGCFAGFGKEFVTLAQDRDIRKIDQANPEQMLRVYDWCNLAPDEGKMACLNSALNSFYWGGENDPKGAINFCNTIPDQDFKSNCFDSLFSQISYYIKDPNYYQKVCQQVPDLFQDKCHEILN